MHYQLQASTIAGEGTHITQILMNLLRPKTMSIRMCDLVNHKLVQLALQVLEIGHVAGRADDGRGADLDHTLDVLEPREGAVRRQVVRGEHNTVRILDGEDGRAGDDGLPADADEVAEWLRMGGNTHCVCCTLSSKVCVFMGRWGMGYVPYGSAMSLRYTNRRKHSSSQTGRERDIRDGPSSSGGDPS